MSQRTAFISHKKLTLSKDGTYRNENVTGQVFICTMASLVFEMQFNDGSWFDWDQGLQFNIAPDVFTKMAFRAKNFDEDTQIEFYTGVAQLADARLNIIRDPNHYQILQSQPKTLVKPSGLIQISANTGLKFFGTGGPGIHQAGVAYAYRKAIVVTNRDPLNELTVTDLDTSFNLNQPLATVFPRQAWMLETSADLGVLNDNSVNIPGNVCEVFYPA